MENNFNGGGNFRSKGASDRKTDFNSPREGRSSQSSDFKRERPSRDSEAPRRSFNPNFTPENRVRRERTGDSERPKRAQENDSDFSGRSGFRRNNDTDDSNNFMKSERRRREYGQGTETRSYNRDENRRPSSYGKPFNREDNRDGSYKPAERKPFDRERSSGGAFDRKPFDRERSAGGFERKPFERKPFDRNSSGGGFERKPFDRERSSGEGSERKSFERKPFDRERSSGGGFERKPFDRERSSGGGFERKPFDRERSSGGGFERKPFDRERSSGEGFERKSFERKPFDRERSSGGSFERKPFDRERSFGENSDRKPFERKSFGDNSDRKPFDRERSSERSYERKSFDRDSSDRGFNKENPDEPNFTNVFNELKKGDIRLNRYVSMSGVCSRREADELILSGKVAVNGEVVTEMGTKVTMNDVITFDGQILKGEKSVYILMNKPKDFVTTLDDPNCDKIVTDLLANRVNERVYPVGRLDKSSLGVLLLTNDGELTKILTHPSYNKKKLYHVFLDKDLTDQDFDAISTGVELEDGIAFADEISIVKDNRTEVGIEIHSGRNRIVRRLFEHLGYKVRKLDRVSFAGLSKKGLKRGEWRFLTKREVDLLKAGKDADSF